MSELRERSVRVRGEPCRVWEKGEGAAVGYLAGLGGLLEWTPFLDRLAESRRVIAPSLPGFPGATGHHQLDTTLDWISATLDLLEAADLEGADLIGASVGGALAAEVAAISPRMLRKLVLEAPFGLFDEAEPVTDPWAQPPGALPQLLAAHPERLGMSRPEEAEAIEWQVLLVRASEAAARLLWPTTDTGLGSRLYRVRTPTLLIWGSADAIVPASYAKRFADKITGPTQIRSIEAAGHLVDRDAPDAVAEAVLEFLA